MGVDEGLGQGASQEVDGLSEGASGTLCVQCGADSLCPWQGLALVMLLW